MLGTAFDRALARAERDPKRGFLFCWNRGLGDIVLALVPLFERIHRRIPAARIEVVTRAELDEPFRMTDADTIHVLPGLAREAPIALADLQDRLGLATERYAAIFTYPDPTRWLRGRRQEFPPRLRWSPEWDARARHFVPESDQWTVAVHVNSETAGYYSYVKDWPEASWRALFERFAASGDVRWLLLGRDATQRFEQANVLDLRGRTGFLDVMALIRHRCRALVAPDSGILSSVFYLDAAFPLGVVSLWSDPRQGILLQGCPSPNPLLCHRALVGREEDVRNIGVDEVERHLREALALATRTRAAAP